jgi:hypothetical protein
MSMPSSPEVNGFRHPQGVARGRRSGAQPRELALLEFLLRRRSEVVSKREILELFHGRLRPGSAGEKLDHSLADAG